MKSRLLLKNHTDWSTRDLRRFVLAGIKAEGVEGKSWTVTVKNARQRRGCSGLASMRHPWMTLRIPSVRLVGVGKPAMLPDYLRDDFAHVLWHEIAHTRGVEHREMTGGWDGCRRGGPRGAEVAWASALTIGRKADPKRRDRKAERREAAVTSLAAWQRKLKLAQTKVRKYRAKVQRYERLAACAVPEATETSA